MMEDEIDISNLNSLPSVKDLASSDPSLRRASFNNLTAHLETRQTLSNTQALQLWKGFFYLLWMHDPRVPMSTPKLISEISSLIGTVPENIRPTVCESFWETMAREWRGIDRARLDKYLSLVRMTLREEFTVIAGSKDEAVDVQLDILGKWPLSADTRKVPDGLRYQVLDCWGDELIASGLIEDEADGGDASPEKRHVESTRKLMGLVKELRKNAMSRGVKMRAREVLEEEQLKPYV